MVALKFIPNMGSADRLIRGTLGALMLVNGLSRDGSPGRRPGSRVEAAVGGVFLAAGLMGFDPLLAAFGASSQPGEENNVVNLFRRALPGQGIHPSLTEQAVPPQPLARRFSARVSVAEALAVP